jgi:uroporphyrin-III C-methyltransferase/precorrin-2 dehydrogenase/sirohydrochlorin ferrochelatase
MKSFPMFIKTTDRRVIIVGGGEQAAQKARLILKTDALIVLAALDLDDELTALVDTGRATHHAGPLTRAFFAGAAMVFIASGCFAVDISAHVIAKDAGCLVNVVDQPTLCDMTTPSLVDRDPVVVAIGTEGTAPVLARQIKTLLEEALPQNLGGLAALAGRLRGAVAAQVTRARRREFWRWVFADTPRQLWTKGAEAHAARAIKAAIAAGGAPTAAKGSITLIPAPPGARDLLTLRAVQRLQEADVIFYDPAAGEDALELARRDAERIPVSGPDSVNSWPLAQTDARILAEAKQGRRVVKLTTSEDVTFTAMMHARRDDISVECVPSVSVKTDQHAAQQQRTA